MPIDHPGFRAALAAAGLVPPGLLLNDRHTHRCQVEGKKRSNRSGEYMLTEDGGMGGYRNWAAGGEWTVWLTARPSQLTSEQRFKFLAQQRAAADQVREERSAARHKAVSMWTAAAEGSHPYLDRKGICSNGSRVLGDMLLVPVRDWDGEMHSIQTITSNGEKRFLRGGRLGGCFHWVRIGQQAGPLIYVAEGFATASTIHAATAGKPVAVAFCASNIAPVCRVLRKHLPRIVLIICADNDRTTGNPGVTAATKAALEVGARMAIPQGMAGTDFNDLMAEHGIPEVKRQLSATVKPKKNEQEKENVDGV